MNQELWTTAGGCVAVFGAAMYARQRYRRWRENRAASLPNRSARPAVPSGAERDGNDSGIDALLEAAASAPDCFERAPGDALEAMDLAETRIHRACELLPSTTPGQRAPAGDVRRISRG